jgi:acetyl esterase/lipase
MPGPTLRPVARTATHPPARVDGPPAGPIEIDVRTRVFTWITDRVGAIAISRMSADDLARARSRRLSHNVVTSRVFGPMPEDVSLTDLRIAGPEGPLTLRLYRPHGPQPVGRHPDEGLPVVLNFHGGGGSLGNLDQSDWLCAHVAARVGALVVSVDYRLPPEHHSPPLPRPPPRRRAPLATPRCAGWCATPRPSAGAPTGSR